MSRDVTGRGSAKEEFLALIFVIMFMVGLLWVYYVDTNWETTTTEEVWVSDGGATVPHYPYHYMSSVPYAYEGNMTWRTRVSPAPTVFIMNDTTPVYNGNNTWIASVDDTGLLPTGDLRDYIQTVFTIPNTDTFLMNSVDYRLYYGAGQNPDSVNVFLATWVIDGELDSGDANPDQDQLNVHIIDTFVPTGEYDNDTATIPLAQALDFYGKSQIADTEVFLIVQMIDDNGWGFHDVSVSMSINGTYIKGYSANTMISLGLLVSGTLNVIMGLFMTDRIDANDVMDALKRRR